jgi:hypothetical protein
MKNITRFSLALMMFTLFSISYLMTSASAEKAPNMAPPGGTPPPGGMAPPGGTPPPGGMAPPGGVAPKTGDPTPSGGLTGWIRGLLGGDKSKKDMTPPSGMAPPVGQ